MIDKLIEILGLKEYENIRKVAKNTFYKVDDFSRSNEKLFTKDIDSIHIISALNKNIINISEYKTEEHNYSEIYYIYVKLKSNTKISEINKIIHSVIPNPCVIALGYRDKIILSTATKRINKNDKTKQVIEEYFITEGIDLDYQEKDEIDFLQDISLLNNSFENFKRFYLDISNKILTMRTSKIRGGYRKTSVENVETLLNLYNNYKQLNLENEVLNKEFDNEIAMGSRAILHTKLKDKQNELSKVKENIKEI